MQSRLFVLAALFTFTVAFGAPAQDRQPKKEPIPHGQTSAPGPALSPQEALKKMQVPPGFRVELVAAEPDIVNPVAMTFDERGRLWITESIEYPRRSAGPGKDRVKLLESTRGDGKFDKITTVITGLNIPSGIAVGHGGVWVANAPDILFYPFEDFAKAKLGKPQVVVTGFGRTDTHELPNSLTWGPDGWLYGLNGVFNHSHVKHKGKEFKFTCAMFRIHPKTKGFEIFCEGTSNPWGLAFNDNGDAFVSACVIDHLWHLTETGYYHRQGGPYPPYTWKIGSIVKHRHQKAAYCGLCWFDSDAYPPEYREKLYMGNIHGNCINCDELTRDGSTYLAKPRPDFLTANDPWFMPVSQKVGPDGCMYILDWYDRYHCYQDANRDPAGIDRLHGRLYRVVYKDYKAAGKFDLNENNDLTELLDSPNIYFRENAQRILAQRGARLEAIACNNPPTSRRRRLHALWACINDDQAKDHQLGDHGTNVLGQLLSDDDPTIRAWAIRAVAARGKLAHIIRDGSRNRSPEVLLQAAIAARKIKGLDPIPVLLDVLTHCGDDKLIPHIVWQNLHPLLEKDGERFLSLAAKADLTKAPGLAKLLPHAIDRILGNASGDPAAVVKFLDKLAKPESSATAKMCLAALAAKVQNGELSGVPLAQFKKSAAPMIRKFLGINETKNEAVLLGTTLGDMDALTYATTFFSFSPDVSLRLRALDAMIAGHPGSVSEPVSVVLLMPTGDFRRTVLGRLGKINEPWVADVVLATYRSYDADEKAKSIELLTQRPVWAKALFKEIAAKKISKDVVNVNQARRLLGVKDAELTKLVQRHWGIPRDSRNPEREKVTAQMKELFKKMPGDAKAGALVFKKLCAQCHKIYGEGVDVGPDLTSNGRADFDQLLSNIFDPSLVIGAGYQAVTVNTRQGQVVTGLLVEDNVQRVVLKVQGGELKTIARADVDEQFTSKLSLMPEDLEKQLQPQEIVDLLSYLSLDRPPEDPKARTLRRE
jgi:putative membrane-bound dehydrogenase-like protein